VISWNGSHHLVRGEGEAGQENLAAVIKGTALKGKQGKAFVISVISMILL
jgi:hypothetical protein